MKNLGRNEQAIKDDIKAIDINQKYASAYKIEVNVITINLLGFFWKKQGGDRRLYKAIDNNPHDT